MHLAIKIIVMLGFVLTSYACRPVLNTSTDLGSLGNFTGATFSLNSCTPKFALHPKGRQYETTVQEQLRAVPLPLQEAFFDDLRGKIVLTKDINRDCQPDVRTTSRPEESANACWQLQESGYVLYLKDDSAKIRHSTLRALAYLYAGPVTSRRFLKDDRVELTTYEDNDLILDKEALLVAIISDLSQKGSLPSNLASQLPAGIGSKQLTHAQRRQLLRSSLSEDIRMLLDAALAETADSWFCSEKTLRELKCDFPETFGLARPVMADLAKYPDDYLDSINCHNSTLNLTASSDEKLVPPHYCGFFCRNGQEIQRRRLQNINLGAREFSMLHHAAAMQLSNAAKEQPQGFGLTNLDAMQIIMIILTAFIGDGSMLLGGGLVDPGMNQNNIINQPLPDHLLQQNLQPNDPNIIDPSIIDPSAAGLNAQEQEIVRLTNEYRQRNGLNALTVSHELSVGCRKQAEHPQGGRQHCVYPCNGSENIGWNYSSPEAVVQGWIESPEHNRNMLGNHREMGAGWATPESNPHQCQRFR